MVETVIFDWKRTLYDPDNQSLISGARDVLEHLKEKNLRLVLIGRGDGDMESEVDRLEVRGFFSGIHFVAEKDEEIFKNYIDPEKPETTMVVGDRALKEVALGKKLGAQAIWLCSGKFAGELPGPEAPLPDAVISLIDELPAFIS